MTVVELVGLHRMLDYSAVSSADSAETRSSPERHKAQGRMTAQMVRMCCEAQGHTNPLPAPTPAPLLAPKHRSSQ
jgi:hypothetical protein